MPRLLPRLLIAVFFVLLNETTVGVALPAFMADFGIESARAQWLVSGYLLTIACVLPSCAAVIARLGPAGTMKLGVAVFLAGTVVAAVAPTFEIALIGRIVQACGGAPLLPLLTSTVVAESPPEGRGRAMGRASLVVAIAPALGPAVAGLLSPVGWRWLFVPAIIAASALLIRRPTDERASPGVRIDVASALLSVGAVTGLAAAAQLAITGAAPAIPIAVGAAGCVAAAAFVTRQLCRPDERVLLRLRVLESRRLAIGAASLFAAMAGLFGVYTLLPLAAIDGLGLSPLATGIVMLPGGLLTGLAAPLVGRLADAIPARRLTVPGLALMAVAAAAMATVPGGDWPLLLAVHLTLSAGVVLTLTPLYAEALRDQQLDDLPHAGTLLSVVQQAAAGLGTVTIVAAAVPAAALGFGGAALLLVLAAAVQAVGPPRRPSA